MCYYTVEYYMMIRALNPHISAARVWMYVHLLAE
jgi:hypothetical protein